MQLRVRATRLGGRVVPAHFLCDARVIVTDGDVVVLVVGRTPVPPDAAPEAHYEILQATQGELDLLRRGGYRFRAAAVCKAAAI